MARPRKPLNVPPPPDFFKAYGDVPADDPAECTLLAAMLPSIADHDTFQRELRRTSHLLHMRLSERKRFNAEAAKAVLASLEVLQGRLECALAAMDDLGYDASEALERQAERQPRRPRGDKGETLWQWLESTDARPIGRDRVGWIKRALTDCACWAAEARAGIWIPRANMDPPDPDDPTSRPRHRLPGRPPDENVKAAMRSLRDIWIEQTGMKRSYTTDPVTNVRSGEFIKFCEAVIVPIYRANGIDAPSIREVARVMFRRSDNGGDA